MPNVEDHRVDSPSWEECIRLLGQVPDLDDRGRAEVFGRVLRNPSAGIRARALHMAAATLPDDDVVAFLREDADDVLRNAGLEILKIRGRGALPTASGLLRDADPDIVLQAVIILDYIRDPRGLDHLRPMLRHPDPNVIQAVLVALGHLGDRGTVRDIVPFLGGDPWLQVAAIQALGDLRFDCAVSHLEPLLEDGFLGPFAADAIGRIGGRHALRALVTHWLLERHKIQDTASFLGLLARASQGSRLPTTTTRELIDSLAPSLRHGHSNERRSAAECVLSLGPSVADEFALSVLSEGEAQVELPACLEQRKDLCMPLLRMGDPCREWGLQLLVRYPRAADAESVAVALSGPPPCCLDDLAVVLGRLGTAVVPSVMALYRDLPPASRGVLAPALRVKRHLVREFVADQDLASDDQILLEAHLGATTRELISRLEAVDGETRARLIPLLPFRKGLMRALPWKQWVDEDARRFAPVFGIVVGLGQIHELAGYLQTLLGMHPCVELIRAAGALRATGCVPELLRLVDSPAPLLRVQTIQALGLIGGTDAKRALAETARGSTGPNSWPAYQALAMCADRDDGQVFRDAIASPDWVVRMSCAEYFARHPEAENLSAIARLAVDPVPAVADRVRSCVEA